MARMRKYPGDEDRYHRQPHVDCGWQVTDRVVVAQSFKQVGVRQSDVGDGRREIDGSPQCCVTTDVPNLLAYTERAVTALIDGFNRVGVIIGRVRVCHGSDYAAPC